MHSKNYESRKAKTSYSLERTEYTYKSSSYNIQHIYVHMLEKLAR